MNQVVLAVGYKHEQIIETVGHSYKDLEIAYSIEATPLGTGGAVKQAVTQNGLNSEHIIIINGDTYFPVNLINHLEFHKSNHCDVSFALKRVHDSERYGAVVIDDQKQVVSFNTKNPGIHLINGGVYAVKADAIGWNELPDNFSFEKHLANSLTDLDMRGIAYPEEFIDIGIPSDYEKFQKQQLKNG